MTRSTSDAADCCSRASASSCLRAAFSFCRSLEAFGVFRAPEICRFAPRPLVITTKPAARPRAATCPRCEAMKPSAAPSAVSRLSANVYQHTSAGSATTRSDYITLYHPISLRISFNSAMLLVGQGAIGCAGRISAPPVRKGLPGVRCDDHRGVAHDLLLGLARAAADATLTPFQRHLVWLHRVECLNCRTIRAAIVPPLVQRANAMTL